jgi:hypothetical protein
LAPAEVIGAAFFVVALFSAGSCGAPAAGRPLVRGVVCDIATGVLKAIAPLKALPKINERMTIILDAPFKVVAHGGNPFHTERFTKNAAAM